MNTKSHERNWETASWVIVDETGKAIMETFSASVAAKVNTQKYRVIPILEWLYSLNRTPRGTV